MKKLFFPMNLGSGNRGCEAIIRGTTEILGTLRDYVYLLDKDNNEYALDCSLKLDQIGNIFVQDSVFAQNKLSIFYHKVMRKLRLEKNWFTQLQYKTFLAQCGPDTPVFFTGGDLYCYESTVKINTYLHEKLHAKHVPTVLWGASVSSDFLNDDVVKQLKDFTRIICRETYSLANLKKVGVSENVSLYPDPAFVLNPVKTKLLTCFETSDIVGINISNFVNPDYSLDTMFGDNIINLVQHILDTSKMDVLIVPHVTWHGQDDRIICRNLYDRFAGTNRVHLLEMDKLSYCEIRYIISQCRFFIGARTHSVISGYSTLVPTIALGYSVKSRGIAHDLGLDEQLVVDCKKLKSNYELVNSFDYLVENEKRIKQHMIDVMPGYINKAYEAQNAVADIIN